MITVVGDMRIGKSTFLNLLAHILDFNIQSEIFKTSPGLLSETFLAWVYPYPLKLNNQFGNMQVLLVDTEG